MQLVYTMMRWLVLLLLVLSCTQEVNKRPPPDFPKVMIENLENGFGFKWIVKREKDDIRTTLKASGVYRSGGDFDMDGTIDIGEVEEPIFEINPYIEIKNLTGMGNFKLISHKGDELIYSFTANLSLFSPGGKEGEGKLIIKKEGIKKISAKTQGIDWEMNIEPKYKLKRESIEITENFDLEILKERLEYYGERKVEIKGNRIFFEETIPLAKDGLLFKRGDYSVYEIMQVPEGEFILSPDSIEQYNPKRKIYTEIEDVSMREDEHGGYQITVDFSKPIEAVIIGILIDGELFGIGHPSGLTLRFIVRNDRLSREIYAILKAHAKKS